MTQPTDDEVLEEILWKVLSTHEKVLNGPVPARFLHISDPEIDPIDLVHSEAKQTITAHFAKKQELAELKKQREELSWVQQDAWYEYDDGSRVLVAVRITQLDAAIKAKEEAE